MTLLLSRAFGKETRKREGREAWGIGLGGVRGGTGINETAEGEGGRGRGRSRGREGGRRELETSARLALESAPNRISVSDLLIIYPRCNFSYQ